MHYEAESLYADRCKLVTICSHGERIAGELKVFHNLLVTGNNLEMPDPETRKRLSRKAVPGGNGLDNKMLAA